MGRRGGLRSHQILWASIVLTGGAVWAAYSASLLDPTDRGVLQCRGVGTLASDGLVEVGLPARRCRAALGWDPSMAGSCN